MTFHQFLEEYNRLKLKYPHLPTHSTRCENSDYGDYLYGCKNAYFSFDTSYSENITYLFDSHKAKNCVDGDYVVESENCYQCLDIFRTYNCTYLNYCARMYDSYFCWDCTDSNNLFGCVHLKHKQYCIFNRQYAKHDYEKKVKELLTRSPEESLKEMEKLSMGYPVTTTNITHVENCDYCNHVHYSKNMYLSFDSAHSENSGYLYDAHRNKDCFDLTQSFYCQSGYECVDSARLSNCYYVSYCTDMYDSGFCENCSKSHNLFGCVGLTNKAFFMLNKQYSETDYEKEVKTILESFKKTPSF